MGRELVIDIFVFLNLILAEDKAKRITRVRFILIDCRVMVMNVV